MITNLLLHFYEAQCISVIHSSPCLQTADADAANEDNDDDDGD